MVNVTKLKVLISIMPAGATTKSTYVGAGAGALVRGCEDGPKRPIIKEN